MNSNIYNKITAHIPLGEQPVQTPSVFSMKSDGIKHENHDNSAWFSTRLLPLLFLMLTLGVKGAWGQETGDYSGLYYICSGMNRGAAYASTNYYLCPTENWYWYQTPNNYTTTDNGRPFMTTYCCLNEAYGAENAVWIVEKLPGQNYYYIKRAIDGRYLTFNGSMARTVGVNRMRLHLEPTASDDALFSFEPFGSDGAVNIIAKSSTKKEYLNVNKANKNNLKGQDNAEGGIALGGIIGLWTEATNYSIWYLEPATIAPPVITNNYSETETFTITAEAGATIYYTTDGTTPTTSTPTSGTTTVNLTVSPTSDVQVIKALAKSPTDYYPTIVTTYNIPVCERPHITINKEGNATITANTGASIYYTLDDTEATPSSGTLYDHPFAMGGATAIRAIAIKPGCYRSAESFFYPPTIAYSTDDITDMNRSYMLTAGFNSKEPIGTAENPFRGTIDGNLNTLSNLTHPLVAYADGAIIKNLFLDNVSISGGTNVGAICNEATGETRIYNCGVLATGSTVKRGKDGYTTFTSCSSTVSGSNYVGGLVGLLDGSSRVINCFSYANITGGSYMGGIVGYNNVPTTSTNLKTMVMNCMFYGDITGTGNKAPVYNGMVITNRGDESGVGNFNYFRAEASYAQNNDIQTHNCALMAETRFLQRFEFFRHLLNSHRELAAWWAIGDVAYKDEMLKWVMEPSQIDTSTPYPILKEPGKYPSVVNFDAANASTGKPRNQGGKLGTLTVNIEMGDGARFTRPTGAAITTSQLHLNITDKDTTHFNYNYYKVQLPYYNDVGTKNYTGDRVVVGWKITSVSGGTTSFTSGSNDAPDWNFADRHCTDKDLYSVSGRIFNQGDYWDVPEGVSTITIQPYWAKAAYVADDYRDVVYNLNMGTEYNVKPIAGGQWFTEGSSHDFIFNGETLSLTVHDSISNAISALAINKNYTVFDYAIVLVGNYHQYEGISNSNDIPYSLMSADFDNDNEPDYSYILRFNARTILHPLRVDFLNVPGFGMAQKSRGGTGSYNFGIPKPRNWFEVTNTALFRVTQMEYSPNNRAKKPIILHGGVIEQWVSSQGGSGQDPGDRVSYFHVGDNVWFKEFHIGVHQDYQNPTPHPPVSVSGGDYDQFFLTGLYRADANHYDDNAECYINGGRFGIVGGGGYEGIGHRTNHTNGNITWQIDHADIDEFYGGGLNFAHIPQGSITTTISNSHVRLFCGGPKFGDMNEGKTVTTTATNCTFGTYFGAGYGGNSYNRIAPYNYYEIMNIDWNTWVTAQYTQVYNSSYGGISTQIDYQFLPRSDNQTNVARIFVDYVSFSSATTRDITSTLTGCTITGNYYGGGSLGKVVGPVTSTLTDCTVNGSVFGAGYSATLPEIYVDSIGFRVEPYYYENFGTFRPGVKGTAVKYEWKEGPSASIDKTNHIIYTTEDLDALGTVSGLAKLDIKGNTVVEGNVYDKDGNIVESHTGGVFGGGDESSALGNTEVNIQGGSGTNIYNVFGGGNNADVKGDTQVNVEGGTVNQHVYGGGKGHTTEVVGNVTVNIGKKTDGVPPVYEGSATIAGNVYGGSALGNTNARKGEGWTENDLRLTAEPGKATSVNLYKGTVTGNVFGGGLGRRESGTVGDPGYVSPIASNVYGPVTVTVEGKGTAAKVFGCNDQNGAPQSTVAVYIKSTQTPDPEHGLANPVGDVFGGGNLAAYTGSPMVEMSGGTVNNIYGGGLGSSAIVTGATSVSISDGTVNTDVYGGGSEANVTGNVNVSITGGTVKHDVYGGGALANTNTDWIASDKSVTTPNTIVSVTGGTINHIYGGGLGRKAALDVDPVAAQSGNVLVELNKDVDPATKKGAVVKQIFGANNINGTPLGHVTVHVYGTQHADKTKIAEKYTVTESLPEQGDGESLKDYLGRLIAIAKPEGTPIAGVKAEVIAEAVTTYGKDSPTDEELQTAIASVKAELNGLYDVQAVFGGGNEADYIPADAIQSTEVIIEGCDYTSIRDVYGGGNAAAVPATDVWILGNKIIDNVFGGGNGELGPEYAAHVGFHRLADLSKEAYATDCGEANTKLVAGTIHNVFGGSNSNGDIRKRANILMPQKTEYSGYDADKTSCCTNLITNHIYGGGKNAHMTGGTNIVLGCMPDSWIEEIYAGAQAADVEGDVSLTITSGKFERVFGGNKDSGMLKGAITVNIEETGECDVPIIIGELYGGGYKADYSVYGYNDNGTVKESGETPLYDDPSLNILSFTSIGAIYGGGLEAKMVANPQIDINVVKGSHYDDDTRIAGVTPANSLPYPAHEKGKIGAIGNVFGGGNLANVIGNTTVNIGTKTTAEFVTEPVHLRTSPETPLTKNGQGRYEVTAEGANITGNVYGGGNQADIVGDAQVYICARKEGVDTYTSIAEGTAGITITGNVFGAGKGQTTNVNNTEVVMAGGSVKKSVYGGSELGCVEHDTQLRIMGGYIGDAEVEHGGATIGNVYGGGMGTLDNANDIDDVKAGLIKGNTHINISGGTIYHNIYGGGAYGSVGTYTYDGTGNITGHTADTGTANITITGGTIGINGKENGMVFGSSRGDVGAPNDIHDQLAWVYNTNVVIGTSGSDTGPAIKGSVYGSGENGHTSNDASVTVYSGTIGVHDTDATVTYHDNSNDPSEVTYTGYDYNYPYRGNVYGGGCGTDQYEYDSDDDGINDQKAYNPKAGFVGRNTSVIIMGGQVVHNVYGAGSMGKAIGSTTVTIGGGTIGVDGSSNGNVYGAARGNQGLSADFASVAGTTVAVSGGTVRGNVFGGGENGMVKGDVSVTVSGGQVVNDVYGGGALADTNIDNWNPAGTRDAYTMVRGLTTGESSVTGYYVKSGSEYVLTSDPTAVEGKTYYNKTTETGNWADGKNPDGKTTYKTSVILYGGLIGNAYGGGLGDATHEANVYGDVTVTVNDPTKVIGGKGIAFTNDYESYTSYYTLEDVRKDELGSVLKNGRVFGCNNINGTPYGNVTVTVYSTRHKDDEVGGSHDEGEWEVQGVYGGGNQSDYKPVVGKKTQVNIRGCGITSIYQVYGGGNAADVPETDVNIYGSFELGLVFGGGNGKDNVKLPDGTWKENKGANVNGAASITLFGGKIGDVYGGSNSKGDCASTLISKSTPLPTDPDDGCLLSINFLYGAGNEASSGAVYIILGACSSHTEEISGADYVIKNIIGGARKADIAGGITLTVTSGDLDNVYGGNYLGGSISGPIVVNIEETDCEPLRIKNLYGAGCNADYPGPDAVYSGTFTKGTVTVNVKSCTSIGTIYGGGYDSNVNGDVQVNINLTKGNWAGLHYPRESSNPEDSIPDHIGTIGTVFGGGNIGHVLGNTEVNIGTSTEVKLVKHDATGHPLNSSGTVVPNPNEEAGLATIDYDTKTVLGSNITGNVYGGCNRADVKGNTTVNIGTANIKEAAEAASLVYEGIKVGGTVYGGGNHGSVGTYDKIDLERPTTCTSGGTATVNVVGNAEIGPDNMMMPTFNGNVFGASKGDNDITVDAYIPNKAFVKMTKVTIGGNAFVKGSVYGGGENGHVLKDTHVTIDDDCQIGNGCVDNTTGECVNRPYNATEWAYDVTADASQFLYECHHFPYGKDVTEGGKTTRVYASYDEYADDYDSRGGAIDASDGHTFYGNVFGGGCGENPYAPGKWLWSAGSVYGNTLVEIKGGHVLTNIYGGNEMTNVGNGLNTTTGKCVVKMTGGTLGVPRTLAQITAHPVTGYLFGAGKGDQRVLFNKVTNVNNVEVEVSGGWIYGSVFGGGEDGHVMGDVKVEIKPGAKIGTWGTSYVDGNVFGGGRGFGGEAYTAGNIGGCVDIYITGGTMLGSIYGGGRLGSVGYGLYAEDEEGYGLIRDDDKFDNGTDGRAFFGANGRGHVNIEISGGTIGNDFEYKYNPDASDKAKMPSTVFDANNKLVHTKGGNVFVGGMGRRMELDGVTPIHLVDWWKVGCVKSTKLTISGAATIKSNVYGGCEFGSVLGTHISDNLGSEIIINGGTVGTTIGTGDNAYNFGSVYGGGMGDLYFSEGVLDPMIGGDVKYNTSITMNAASGCVKGNIYGGGNLGSVGIVTAQEEHRDIRTENGKEVVYGFGLSWPYKFEYTTGTGKATVTIQDGRVEGYVYGGGKGEAYERYTEAHIANVRETEVNINYASTPAPSDLSTANCIVHAVYGGGEDGHVYEDANIEITGGLIGNSVYGGGRGEGTYPSRLKDFDDVWHDTDVCSWTAGKVYGNTEINMSGGHVVRNIYGGGNLGSVGKGNYAGGADDYYKPGYGETLTGNLWDDVSDESKAFLHSGFTRVTITDGTVGTENGVDADGIPTGQVYGSSRGKAAKDIGPRSPRYDYAPEFFLGYSNETHVTIGDASHSPRIYGSVYGGGRDGHVRSHAHVTIENGTIGQAYSLSAVGPRDRGNVYGSGSGMGTWDGTHHGTSSGSVTRHTTVDINGGTIYQNVYGGGAMSSVGPPKITMPNFAGKDITFTQVNINGGTIGTEDGFNHNYGGNVYGASRGGDIVSGESADNYATVLWTEVNINPHTSNRALDPLVWGEVYGGGEAGRVKMDTKVNLTGGTIKHDAYGGGKGTLAIPAHIGGKVTVELNKDVEETAKGCIVDRIFGCNNLYGTPQGHALVHVYATQHAGKATIADKIPPTYDAVPGDEGYKAYLNNLITDAKKPGGLAADAAVITAAQTLYNGLPEENSLTDEQKTDITDKANDIIAALDLLHDYDVTAVYGGGNLAPYQPTDNNDNTEVIIEGCKVTSIKQVYGGGNAACVPSTDVKIKECFIIDEVFGGGNGNDKYQLNGKWYENPGANVGYTNFAVHVTDGPKTGSSAEDAYPANDLCAVDDKACRAAYTYGRGEAKTTVTGGHIHNVYGGSNKKGNISSIALSQYQKSGTCPLITDKTYGGGKNAPIDGEIQVVLDCVESGGDFYGGSEDADINNNVTINITNGTFGKVFGGNNLSGSINGVITINIEEKGCTPIVIGELYGGGNYAPYSVYGYKKNGSAYATTPLEVDVPVSVEYPQGKKTVQSRIPLKKGETGALATPHRDPHINIISATSIGAIYGGGYKAPTVGNPHVNVNMQNGVITANYKDKDPSYAALPTDPETGNKILPIGTIGDVFGGGNQADVIGNTHVDIGTGSWYNYVMNVTEDVARNAAFITGSVFGGGKFGHVGDFTKDATGKPTSCAEGTGVCYVTVSNGEIGRNGMQMTTPGGPDDYGHVFGGGRGTEDFYFDTNMSDVEKQAAIKNLTTEQENAQKTRLDNLAYVDATEVTVNGSSFVKGSVYGGGFDGHVLHDTHVTIDGDCQIGCGKMTTERHPASVWAADYVPTDDNNLECAHWPYGVDTDDDGIKDSFQPHDKFADAGGGYIPDGAVQASDGHTFYGNVFGGGSGYYPYAPGKWLLHAGWVEGNTLLEIKGGHILTNVYGGNEMTNVGSGLAAGKGKCTIRMSGGTLGVPRTLTQIANHPVTCYLFGAGKGDQNIHFNKWTNVKEVEMDITGGWIYGSVFGGGEDGHVLGDVKMTIGNSDGTGPKIGTWGTSYVDGNVFGGGRGYSGEALTAGNVGGSVDLNIKGGTMLGSIYGGGRLGSVGYGLYNTDEATYGKMRDNDKDDDGNTVDYYTTTGMNKKGRGHIDINISGGTIGNDLEYQYYTSNVDTEGKTADEIAKARETELAAKKAADNIPNTDFEYDNDRQLYRLTHTKGGNVFTGSMGRLMKLDNKTPLSGWQSLGNAKSTKLTISGSNTRIKSNVYGGGELGKVSGATANAADNGVITDILIQDGTIGTEIKDGSSSTRYTFGSVFGGGYGSTEERIIINDEETNPKLDAGLVIGSTKVTVQDGAVKASVYGGGEVASVKGNTDVAVSGGTIGIPKDGDRQFGGATMGNVYGGGSGFRHIVRAGHIFGDTKVTIGNTLADADYVASHPGSSVGDILKSPTIYHNVYGGGSFGTVGDFEYEYSTHLPGYEGIEKVCDVKSCVSGGKAEIIITGGTIGVDGKENGMIFGSSRGHVDKPGERDDWMAWVNDAYVTIGNEASGTGGGGDGTDFTNPIIKGSVYGSGENGHTFRNTEVNIHSGKIGIDDEDDPDGGAAYAYRGSVYGAGCGTDAYLDKDDGKEKYNRLSGIVYGDATVNIDGGHIVHNVYGAGAMASVGKATLVAEHRDLTSTFGLSWPCEVSFPVDPGTGKTTTGKTTININGGRIGVDGNENAKSVANGDVYGGARGEANERYSISEFGNIRTSVVKIGETSAPVIAGSVYGGGENGHVYEDASVYIYSGSIGHSVFGGGKGMGKYQQRLLKIGKTIGSTNPDDYYTPDIYSITAGKVYGDTYVTMSGGTVANNVYGGGNLGSVGKGNYAGGPDDYSTAGYGEKVGDEDLLWTSSEPTSNAYHFLNSGRTYVTVTGGTVGSVSGQKDGLPMGNVFGGCRGMAAPNIVESPRYQYCPEFFLGYVNETDVTIGTKNDEGPGPRIYGSVYGGGQDGHVRRDAQITVYSGEIGNAYTSANIEAVGTSDVDNLQWLHRGNVYGAGSGISFYQYDLNYDHDYNDTVPYFNGRATVQMKESDFSTSAGSVNGSTIVNVQGGIIHRNVYGGGSMASVGPPKIGQSYEAYKKGDATPGHGRGKQSSNIVNVSGTIGTPTNYVESYGGEVYGASRGLADPAYSNYATTVWTQVNIKDGANIKGNVFGGGDNGVVKKDTDVRIGE